MILKKDNDPRLAETLICLVLAKACSTGPSPEPLLAALADLVSSRASMEFPPPPIKEAVRAMLRTGGFKPAGRQKPASEYLAQSAREGRFPSINAPVDCNNILSLETGLPISLLDAAAIGVEALVRIAAEGESYVFNASGQAMDLAGLLCVCGPGAVPLGNPVKDSMAGKIKGGSCDLAGFIYAPRTLYTPTSLTALGQRFAELLITHCAATAAAVVSVV
jgi:DNA/RNA-binding domain of Phe-tRNA-synthetase-like protein